MLCLSGCGITENAKYPSGRDTCLSVGDGRFQILRGVSYAMYDLEKEEFILEDIRHYYDDSKNKKLYLVNKDENYMVIDYENNTYKTYNKSNLSDELKKFFESAKMKKLIPNKNETPNIGDLQDIDNLEGFEVIE